MDQPKTHRLSGYGISESVVCIQSQATGTGVAITPRHVATCAHVVLDALGLDRGQTPPAQADLKVSVWQDGTERRIKMQFPPAWRPVDAGDIALLELDPAEPDLLPACSRVIRGDQWSRQIVDVYGYPQSFKLGQLARLECHNAIGSGDIQCSPVREGIDHGYSGGPAFNDAGELLGLARSLRRFQDPQLKYDYLIPIARVLELLPQPDIPLRQPYFELARAFQQTSAVHPTQLMAEVRRVPPHTLTEYRLRRRLWDWETRDIRLDFTPLLLLLEEKRRSSEFGQGPTPVPYDNLNQVLQKESHSVFLLKGAPGGGKTTLLKRLAFDLCSQEDGLGLPILIELSRHKGTMAPGAWLAQEWRNNYPDMPQLDELSQHRSILWLLDGLNELPDEPASPRQAKIAGWRDWLATQAGCHRAIISCRSADYLDELDTMGDQVVPHLELQPLDLAKIGEFLHNRSALTPQQAEDAVQRIKDRKLVPLYNTPLMLTLLEQVLSPAGDFPNGRAELFSAYLCRLINREANKHGALFARLFSDLELKDFAQAARPSNGYTDPSAHRLKLVCHSNPLLDALSEQAYQRQRAVYQGERQEVSFERREFRDALCERHGAEQGERLLLAAQALNLVVETEDHNIQRFRHHQFQEFFAARQLVAQGELALVAAPYRPADFRYKLEQIRANLQPWQELPGVDRSGWEETTVMAAELAADRDDFIEQLATVNLPLAGQCAASLAPRINSFAPLAERLLARMRDAKSDLRARIAAGKALGEMQALEVLGYQSLTDVNGKRIAWLPPIEPIPGGEYHFGSRDDPEAYDDEHPFATYLVPFRLGCYPVTNAEWACFLRAGGYANVEFWRGQAARDYRQKGSMEGEIQFWIWWREGYEQGSLEEDLAKSSLDEKSREQVRGTVTLDTEQWVAHLDDLRRQTEPVTEPSLWRISRFNNPLQPVVGISLFEALAYCRWLSEITGERYSLPDELQWEAAARGRGNGRLRGLRKLLGDDKITPRRYAWGNRFLPDLCNSRDSRDAQERVQVGATTPVGLYAMGRTPDTGLYDMTGNVWEWTHSAYREQPPYDTDPLDALEEASQSRVVRGGSWGSDLRDARAASRAHGSPDSRDGALGCRLCVLPPMKPES